VSGILVILLSSTACEGSPVNHAPPPEPAGVTAQAVQAEPQSGARSSEASEPGRRIIRTAELSLESDAPETAGGEVAGIAESKGGFVVSSEAVRTRRVEDDEDVSVTVVFRVPATTFDATLQAVRALAKRVLDVKVTGQDVTAEYVDVEARLKAQRAVEDQYMAILKEAKSVHDILEVQQKLGDVRTEIDRAEGRRRFLEHQTSLSTFTVHLVQRVEAIDVSGPGFGNSVTKAGHDVIVVSIAIVNGTIRAAGVLLPVTILVGAPIWLVVRWLLRRRRKAT
jgi:hypothetical protein